MNARLRVWNVNAKHQKWEFLFTVHWYIRIYLIPNVLMNSRAQNFSTFFSKLNGRMRDYVKLWNHRSFFSWLSLRKLANFPINLLEVLGSWFARPHFEVVFLKFEKGFVWSAKLAWQRNRAWIGVSLQNTHHIMYTTKCIEITISNSLNSILLD